MSNALLFPGQGSQSVGMGKELYDSSPSAKSMFDRFEKIYPGIADLCFHGSEDDLKKTESEN